MKIEDALAIVEAERNNKRYTRTDQGLADRFTLLNRDLVRYVPDEGNGAWRRWTGTHWRFATPTEVAALKNRVQDLTVLEAMAEAERDSRLAFAKRSQSASAINSMVRLAAADEELWSRLDTFDQHPHLLNFRNGTVDLRTGELLPHNPRDMITCCVPHDYVPDARSAKWEALVNRALAICEDGGETAHILQTVFGHALFGRNYEQHLIIINGAPRAGKSKMIEIVNAALGPDYCHTSRPELIIKTGRNGHHESEIYTLMHKRFVSISETDSGMTFDDTRVKSLTGAEELTSRQMYSSREVTVPVTFTIFVATNEPPNVRHWDQALARRLIIFPIGPSLEPHEVNTNIAFEILQEEPEGVLAWLVEGAVRWYKEHSASGSTLTLDRMPLAVRKATNTYAAENDPLERLFSDHIVRDPASVETFSDLYARVSGMTGGQHVNRKALSARLTQLGFTKGPGRGKWTGLRMRPMKELEDLTEEEVQAIWVQTHVDGIAEL